MNAYVGDMAAISIFDIADPDDFLERGPTLVEVANAAAPKLLKAGRESSPRFTWTAKAETLDGCRVDLLTIEVPNLPKEVQRDYEKLLGPDWNKLRVAVQGKQVVLLVGSDLPRLRETLANLKSGAKGLAEQPSVAAALGKLSAERKLEFHLNFSEWNGEKPAKDGAALSSFALAVEADRLQWEVRALATQAREVLKLLGLASD